jgi:hypothetical protein
MTLGKFVLIVKVFVIDPRSKSLGKSTALNGSLATILILFKHISIFIYFRDKHCFSLSVLYRYFMGFLGDNFQ